MGFLPLLKPQQGAALTCDRRLLVLGALQVLLHQFGRHADHVLALPVLDHVERLKRADDVTLRDAGHLTGRGEKKKERRRKDSRGATPTRFRTPCVYLRSLMDSVPLKSLRISSRTHDQ